MRVDRSLAGWATDTKALSRRGTPSGPKAIAGLSSAALSPTYNPSHRPYSINHSTFNGDSPNQIEAANLGTHFLICRV